VFLYNSDYATGIRTLSNNQLSDAIAGGDLDDFLDSFFEEVAAISTDNKHWSDNLVANGRKNALVIVYWRVDNFFVLSQKL